MSDERGRLGIYYLADVQTNERHTHFSGVSSHIFLVFGSGLFFIAEDIPQKLTFLFVVLSSGALRVLGGALRVSTPVEA